jgi:acetyl-CoA carboxylase biotin carboxylase subunit
MGDKASAKATMIEAGCPLFLVQLVFWSHSNKRKSWHDLLVTVMLKGYSRWWWKGMRAVWKDEDLLKAWDGARQVCCCFWE